MRTFTDINELSRILEAINETHEESEERRNSLRKHKSFDFEKHSVLGVDILGYSKFPDLEQTFVPFIFHMTLLKAIKDIFNYEPFLFQEFTDGSNGIERIDICSKNILKRFIPTGDGGYLILNNPLQAVVFAVYFESRLREYNTGLRNKNILDYLGPLKVRYAIAHEDVFRVEDQNNYFGAGIISCARIMAKDTLDRCLIDENVHNWFLKHFNGIEALRTLRYKRLVKMDPFKKFSEGPFKNAEYASFAFRDNPNSSTHGLDTVIVMKIGTISVKKSDISVYNLFIQMPYQYASDDNDHNDPKSHFVISVGNPNSSGL